MMVWTEDTKSRGKDQGEGAAEGHPGEKNRRGRLSGRGGPGCGAAYFSPISQAMTRSSTRGSQSTRLLRPKVAFSR